MRLTSMSGFSDHFPVLVEVPALNSKVSELEEKCAEMQEKYRTEYESELFSTRNRNRIFKYLKSFQKDSFPAIIKCGVTGQEGNTDELLEVGNVQPVVRFCCY